MFDSLKALFTEFTDGDKPARPFEDNDYRVAAAALMIHAAAIDGVVSPVERQRLHTVIAQRFELDDTKTEELIAQATEAERDAVDLYQFTSLLKRSLNEPGRARVVEMMWQIIYADGAADEFEDNLVWRAADLLGVSQHERVALRQRVAEMADGDRKA